MVIFNCSIFLAVLVFFYQNEVEGQNTFKLLLVTSKRVSEEIYNTLANTLPFNFKLRLRFNAFKRFSHQHLNVIKTEEEKTTNAYNIYFRCLYKFAKLYLY